MKRYNAVQGGVYDNSVMVEEKDGDYVEYEEVEHLEAINAELLEVLEKALLMFDKMTDARGPYKYIDGTQLVSDAYDISNLLKQAIAKAKGEGL